MTSSGQLRLAFLGCGFITRVHSRHLKALRRDIVCSYASRDKGKAEDFCREWNGETAYASYEAAIDDPRVDAVLVAVPPRYHLDLTLRALSAGKHVLVEKPAFPCTGDFEVAMAARDRAKRIVIVGENDHYKPQAIKLRKWLADGVIGDLVFGYFTTIAKRFKTADDWRNDETMAGGDAFFEEGIHWLHLANNVGPRITSIHGYRPTASTNGSDRRAKSMLVSFKYDNGGVGSLYYSREIPSLLRGMRLSAIYGREGVMTFESNGLFILARGKGLPRFVLPGFYDFRGYRVMYRDFLRAIREGGAPEMSLERAIEDQRLMEQIYTSLRD
jgi:predicted dehydrogenase